MANREIEINCTNIFKSDNAYTRREEYLNKWAELIGLRETILRRGEYPE